jgi:hypothetical protein
MPKNCQESYLLQVVKCYQYTLLRFRILLWPEIVVIMSYLALTKKKIDGEGKQRTQVYHHLLYFLGEQNGHLPLKRKGGHTAQISNAN